MATARGSSGWKRYQRSSGRSHRTTSPAPAPPPCGARRPSSCPESLFRGLRDAQGWDLGSLPSWIPASPKCRGGSELISVVTGGFKVGPAKPLSLLGPQCPPPPIFRTRNRAQGGAEWDQPPSENQGSRL